VSDHKLGDIIQGIKAVLFGLLNANYKLLNDS